jgi:hypothetical protein
MGRVILPGAFAAIFFTASSQAVACKCDKPRDVADALARADLVFVGHPVARFARWDRFHQYTGWDYAFEIETLWKGQPPQRPLVRTLAGDRRARRWIPTCPTSTRALRPRRASCATRG